MSTSMDYPGGHGTRQSTPESFEMSDKRRWPSTTSMTPSGSRSFYSYTPSHSSYNLPIVMERTNPDKKMPDNWGLACCSMFINPIFGLVAILLAEISKSYYSRCKYKKARQCGQYAAAVAVGGIVSMIIIIIMILALVIQRYLRFRE